MHDFARFHNPHKGYMLCTQNVLSVMMLPLGMIEGSVLKSLSRHSAADCFTTSNVSLNIVSMTLVIWATIENKNFKL